MAESLNRVGWCLKTLGRWAEALPKYRGGAGDEPAGLQGRSFPTWPTSLDGVASLALKSLGRSAEALPKYEAALAMRRRLFEGDHPDVAGSLNNVAGCAEFPGPIGGGAAQA